MSAMIYILIGIALLALMQVAIEHAERQADRERQHFVRGTAS
jgi:hypothetical protein